MLYLQYRRSFKHFRHECGHSLQLAIAGSDTGQYSIDNGDLGLTTRNQTAELSHQHHDANLCAHTNNTHRANNQPDLHTLGCIVGRVNNVNVNQNFLVRLK